MLNADGVPVNLPLLMSDVLIVNSATAASDAEIDQALLDGINVAMRTGQDSVDKDDAILICQRGSVPMSDYDDPNLLVCAFPHLFPFGTGVPKSYTDPHFTRYLMLHHSNAFATEPRLYFLLFNTLQRQSNNRSTALRIRAQRLHVEAVSKITQRHDFRNRLADANADPTSPDAKALLSSLRPHIFSLGANAPYSPMARRASFNHFLAANNRFGLGQVFITMAFDDVNNALALRLSFPSRSNHGFPAEDDGLREALQRKAKIFDARDRNTADDDDGAPGSIRMQIPLGHRDNVARITANPVAAAEYFRITFDAIVQTLFGVPLHIRKTTPFHIDRRAGIFGHLTNFDANLEAQQKGTLHFHGIATGLLSPTVLSAVAHSPVFMKTVAAVFDSMICAAAPADRLLEQLVKERYDDVFFEQPNYAARIPPDTINELEAVSQASAASTHTVLHRRHHTDSCVRCGRRCCRYAKPSGLMDCTNGVC